MAFDPYGTLVWLVGPQFVDQGLSWYTPTTEVKCPGGATKRHLPGAVRHARRPVAQLRGPDGTKTHLYKFPSSCSKSGTVRLAGIRTTTCSRRTSERPAFLVTDPHKAGVYDTVYVDLDDDYDFTDEKPVTKSSPPPTAT